MASVEQDFGSGLGFEVVRDNAQAPVRLIGELDVASVAEFYERISELADGGRLVLDLSELVFIDSSGLRALLMLSEQSRNDGFELSIIRPSPAAARLFELTGTDKQLPLATSA